MEKAIIKRPILAAVKLSGKFTAEERKYLREKAWRKSTDGATMTMTSTDFGRESLLFFDVYVVENLSLLKRFRHALRVFTAAIARNVGIKPRIVIITLK
ncbi:hypothetical protein D1638_08015 [Muribaculaceae bacterium Z1]|nr:hypothetical protein [Muribaculaceae bacterium S4]NBI20858.1 hypothetical protein [Muribaculaceae bacterium Z1]